MTVDQLNQKIRDNSEAAQAILTAANGGSVSNEDYSKLTELDTETKDLELQLTRIGEQVSLGDRFKSALTKAGSGNVRSLIPAPADRYTEAMAQMFPQPVKGFGDHFVETEEFKSLILHGVRGRFKTPPIPIDVKAVVTYPAGGIQSGMLMPALPQFNLFPHVTDLPSQASTDAGMIPAIRELSWTNSAAIVLPGAQKPESGWTYEQVYIPLATIAHWIQVPEQLLSDVSAIRSYLNTIMAEGVRQREDNAVLNQATPPWDGFNVMSGTQPDVAYTTGALSMAILTQIAAIEGTGMAPVDGIVLNPATWALIVTERTTAGQPMIPTLNPLDPLPNRLWGRRVVVTPHQPAGTALLGSFTLYSLLFRNGSVTVQASNEDRDNFIKNLVTIRAESRLALVVLRPAAFGQVTGLVPPVAGRAGNAGR